MQAFCIRYQVFIAFCSVCGYIICMTEQQEPKGIPGLRGAEHIGFTVPDIEQAHEFFTNVIGAEFVYSLGPWVKDDKEIRFYRCHFGPNFEVFEYESPNQNLTQPKNSDVGGHHIAFYVDDMQAAVAHLERHNVKMLSTPTASGAASEGQHWLYFLSPWGMQFELVSYPNGKAYERTATRLLWHPANPAN
jgi:catechol 2,3-dioxygenase-like lactoylglutathione lyase family enzyme